MQYLNSVLIEGRVVENYGIYQSSGEDCPPEPRAVFAIETVGDGGTMIVQVQTTAAIAPRCGAEIGNGRKVRIVGSLRQGTPRRTLPIVFYVFAEHVELRISHPEE